VPESVLKTAMADGLGYNVWFRFQRPDWKDSRRLKDPEGILPGGWDWYLYNRLQVGVTETTVVDLRLNQV